MIQSMLELPCPENAYSLLSWTYPSCRWWKRREPLQCTLSEVYSREPLLITSRQNIFHLILSAQQWDVKGIGAWDILSKILTLWTCRFLSSPSPSRCLSTRQALSTSAWPSEAAWDPSPEEDHRQGWADYWPCAPKRPTSPIDTPWLLSTSTFTST